MRGESGLHIYEYSPVLRARRLILLQGLGFQQLLQRMEDRGTEDPRCCKTSGSGVWGHKLPLEPVRLVSKLPLELSLPG